MPPPYAVIVTNQAQIQNEVDAILQAQQDIIKAIDTNVDDPSAIAAGLLDHATKFNDLGQQIAAKADASIVTALNTIAVANQAKLLELEGEIDTNTGSVSALQTAVDSKVTQAEIDTAVAELASSDDVAAAVAGLASFDDIAHVASSSVPVPLGTVPTAPEGFTPATPVQGYIPVSNQSGRQTAKLVSLFAGGTDGKVDAELVTGPLDNGAIAVVDIILSSTATDVPTVEITNPSNLMSVNILNNASVFGTFKVLSQSGPGPVIVGTYDTTALANSRYYQIRGYHRNEIYADDITQSNALDTSKEFDFEIRTELNKRQIYLRETGTTSWIKDFNDYSNSNLPSPLDQHPTAPFGFVANSNAVLRNLRLDSPYYTQNTDFRDKAPFVDTVEDSSSGITKIALIGFISFMNDRSIGYLQVPNDGQWSSAPDDLAIHMTWSNPFELQNEFIVNNFTSNSYTGITYSTYDKIVGLRSSIPSSLTGILESLKAGATPDEQEIISAVQNSSNVVYLERIGLAPGAGFSFVIKVFPLLIDTVGNNLVGLEVELETPLLQTDFGGLAQTGQASVVESIGVKTDGNNSLDIVKGAADLASIGTGTGQIAKFSDFVNTSIYKTAYPS